MAQASAGKLVFLILIEGIKKIFYFPLWWYSNGLIKTLKWSWNFIKDFEQTLGFMIWVKNLFVPMFGQKDIAGRLISFFLRLVQIIFRGIALLFFILLNIVFIVIYLILPPLIIYQILINI